MPAEPGEIRNLTNTPGVAERDPAWSPDGKWIAYFSDASGEYALHLRELGGTDEAQKIPLGDPPSFYYAPVWSPDGKKIAYTDVCLNLWCVDLERASPGQPPVPLRVDTDSSVFRSSLAPAWSPDSRWLAYTKQLQNHMRAVFVYERATGQRHQLTDGMSDAQFAAFDENGKWLYFTASTDAGPALAGFEMSSYDRPVTRSVYLMLLRQDLPSPLAPEDSDEDAGRPSPAPDSSPRQGPAPAGNRERSDEEGLTRIDLEHLEPRIVALPIPARHYIGMVAGKTGTLFLLESEPFPRPGCDVQTLHRFDLRTRQTEKLLEGISQFALSHNGEKILYRQGDRRAIAVSDQPPPPDTGTLKLDTMEIRADPRAEWRQMYREAWRSQRDMFYDPGYHGLDLKAAEAKYEPYLENLASRADLDYLFTEMFGELSVSHLFLWGGDRPEIQRVPIGLLGADYCIENGRYRFARAQFDVPPLIDGGLVRAPNMAFCNPEGEWEVENHGVAPDIEVELDPRSWRAGRDPQLEAAVEWVPDAVRQHPVPRPQRPPYPDYHHA